MPYSKEIGNKNFYEYYKELSIKKNKSYVTYKEYSNILKYFNQRCREEIVLKSEKFVMPYKLGTLFIKKFTRTFDTKNKNNWRVDFKATKEQGKVVYHTNLNGYYWKWIKKDARVKNQKYYSFKACRKANRMVADAINNKKLDFFEK